MSKKLDTSKLLTGFTIALLLGACGKELPQLPNFNETSTNGSSNASYDPQSVVVRSTAVFAVNTDGSVNPLTAGVSRATSGSTVVTVTNSASTNMTLDTSLFSVPTIAPFSTNDFGFLQLGALADNNLRVCGSGGATRCTVAGIRMYTTGTGTTGAGLWNTAGGYGAPITAGQSGGSLSSVGLNVAGALTLQSINISSSRNTVKLADFTLPKYGFKVDFSDAGAGSYSATVVLEYFLALSN